MSRGGSLLLDGNPNGYEVAEHIDTNVEVNPRMLLTLENAKFICSMILGADFETSVVGHLGIFSCLGQDTNRAGLFQFREIFWDTFHFEG